MITIFFDGLCAPQNPGGIGTYGYLIYRDGAEIHRGCGAIGEGPGMTNNVGEFTALQEALRWLGNQYPKEPLFIKGDSALVINQLKGTWKIRSGTSHRFVPKILKLLEGRRRSFEWISGFENHNADALSNEAYDRYVEEHGKKNRA